MTQTIDALGRFFGGFGLPVYPEDSVPEVDAAGNKVKPPYITVQIVEPAWRDSTPFYARVWYRSENSRGIAKKVDEIKAAIGEGVSVETDSGSIWIFQGAPFAQFQPMAGDTTLKCAYLNMIMHALTE